MSRLIYWLLLCGVVAGAGACQGSKAGVAEPVAQQEEPSRRSVQRRAMRASVWRFVYCVEEGTPTEPLVTLLTDVANRQPFGKRIEVVNCADLTRDTLGSGPLSIFGNRLPDQEQLPLTLTRDSFTFAGSKTIGQQDALLLPYYRNPWTATTTVVGLYLAPDVSRLVRVLTDEYGDNWDRMYWPNWAYEIHRGNGDRVYGSWLDTSWRFDPTQEFKLGSPDTPVYDRAGLRVYAYDGAYSPTHLAITTNNLRHLRAVVDSLLEREATEKFPEVRIYPNLERIGLRRGNMGPVQYDVAKKILHLVPSFLTAADIQAATAVWISLLDAGDQRPLPEDQSDRLVATLQLMAHNQLDSNALSALTNASQLAGENLWRPGEERTSRYLERSRLLYELATRGGCHTSGAKELIAAYRNGRPPAPPDEPFCGLDLARFSTAPPSVPMPTKPLRGMTFAHEGYRMHNGYGGEKIRPSLDSLARLNVNAIAVVPYTFMRNADKPTGLFIPDDGGSENDASVIYSIREAQRRGWSVMLKPQIWLGGGSWPGDVDFDTPEKWDTFFVNYKYWITHYALLAARENVTALCLGTELVQTTLKHPDRWRDIIRTVRKVYGGQLTYAANWGEEFEGLSFGDELDALGLNSYYPLSKSGHPTDAELLASARDWLRMAAARSREVGKPLWLTEVGYRSVADAWINPHAEPNDRPVDLTARSAATGHW